MTPIVPTIKQQQAILTFADAVNRLDAKLVLAMELITAFEHAEAINVLSDLEQYIGQLRISLVRLRQAFSPEPPSSEQKAA
jgi:hypothetical protein